MFVFMTCSLQTVYVDVYLCSYDCYNVVCIIYICRSLEDCATIPIKMLHKIY